MGKDFLEKFIGNHTRAQVVRVFIFAPNERMTVAQVAKRSSVGAPAVGKEIKVLEEMEVIVKEKSPRVQNKKSTKRGKGRRSPKQEIAWILNLQFKYLRALSSFVHEVSPIRYDNILNALKTTGRLSVVIASGCLTGDITRPVDLIVVADNLNESRLEHAIRSLEPLFGRELRYSTFGTMEFTYRLTIHDHLLRDILDYPHKVLLDRAGALK
ncbi:MAG: hypothetical protein Q7S01_06590 [bacterium]|nr:hypothetical protein [bacterium]